ncbi:hypothetical protein Tco_0523632 [Tanacetum coccineum]
MAEQQTIKYAPQWNNMTVDNSTAIAFDPFPSTAEPEKRPLREFLIKFSFLNGQRPLNLDFKKICSSTGLDYNNGKYVAHPIPEAVKKELGNIAINPSYLDKTPVLKNSFLVAWKILFTFVIQVLGGNYSSTEQDENFRVLPGILSHSNFTKDPSKVTDIELMAYMIALNKQKDSVSPPPLSSKPKKGKSQTVTPTLPKSQGPEASGALSKNSKRPTSKKPPTKTKVTWGQRLRGNIPPADMELIHPTVSNLSDTGAKYQEDQTQSSRLRYQSLSKTKSLPPQEDKPQASDTNSSSGDTLKKYDNTIPLTQGQLLLKNLNNVVKDDPAVNKKINEAIETFTKISSTVIEVLSLVKGFNFSTLQSTVKDLQAHALKQDEQLAAWAKSSTNMA